MNKFILAFFVILKLCTTIKCLPTTTDLTTLTEEAALLKCNSSILRLTKQCLIHPQSRDILLRAVGFTYKDAEECQELLEVILPNYLEPIQKMLTYVGLKSIPITKDLFTAFIHVLKKYFENVDDVDDVVNKVKKLDEIDKETTCPNPDDCVKAFHKISSLYIYQTDTPLFESIRSMGINPMAYSSKKSLMTAVVDKAMQMKNEKVIAEEKKAVAEKEKAAAEKEKAAAEKEKNEAQEETMIVTSRYSFRSVMEKIQRILLPSWIEWLGATLTGNTIWEIILSRRDSLELSALMTRIEKCFPFKFSIWQIKEFALLKYAKDSEYIHKKSENFPKNLNETQWNTILDDMDVTRPLHRCIAKGFAEVPKPEELQAEMSKCKAAGTEPKTEYSVFVWLGELPFRQSAPTLKAKLEEHLVKFDKKLFKSILRVIKLEYTNKKNANEALVVFKSETATQSAIDVLQKHPLQLENRNITACIPG